MPGEAAELCEAVGGPRGSGRVIEANLALAHMAGRTEPA